MSVYNIGTFIKYRRSELGLTQEELSEGICSVATLSRIETGAHPPTRAHAQALLQRLGYSASAFFLAVGSIDLEMTDLQLKTRMAYAANNFDAAEEYLCELSEYSEHFSPSDRQFYEIMYTIVHMKEFEPAESLNRFESALRLTHPNYSKENLPHLLTYEEILALNNIAIFSDEVGDRDNAINVLYYLRQHCNSDIFDKTEAMRVLPMILYNLSKYLGLAERYDEAIEICKEGIDIAKKTGKASVLVQTMYNLSYDLLKRSRPLDKESAERYALDACVLAKYIKTGPNTVARLEELVRNNFDKDHQSVSI